MKNNKEENIRNTIINVIEIWKKKKSRVMKHVQKFERLVRNNRYEKTKKYIYDKLRKGH